MVKLPALIGRESFFRSVPKEHSIAAATKYWPAFTAFLNGTNTSDSGAEGSCECEIVTWLLPRSEVDNLDTDPASARLLPKATLCELDNLGSDRDRSFQLRSTSRWEPQNRAR